MRRASTKTLSTCSNRSASSDRDDGDAMLLIGNHDSTRRFFAQSVMAGVFSVLLVASACTRKPSDQGIAQNVEQHLAQDPALKKSDIHVSSSNGSVILTGTVASENQKLEAGRVAGQVDGVKQVIISLDREPPRLAGSHPTPSQISKEIPHQPSSQSTTPMTPPLTPASAITHTWTDPIDRYLASKPNPRSFSPMTGRGSVFESDGLEYTIDPRLIVAISGAETSFATGKCHKTPVAVTRNAWNWFWCYGNNSCGTDVCGNSAFDSWDSGIKTVSKFVKRNYVMKGLTDVRKIQVKYCTEGCDYWVKNVQSFMQQMGGDPENLTVVRPFSAE